MTSGDVHGITETAAQATPALAVALLLARPRQRATQLAKRPVKTASVVAPARAPAAWRLAALDALNAVDCAAGSLVAAPLACVVGAVARDASKFGAADETAVSGTIAAVDVGCHGVEAVLVKCGDGAFETVDVAGDDMRGDRAGLTAAATNDAVPDKGLAKRIGAAVAKALASVGEGSFVVVRGEGALRGVAAAAVKKVCSSNVVEADPDDAVRGATVLAAAALGLPDAPDALASSNLARDVGVAPLTRGKVDVGAAEPLFVAGAALPCSARRTSVRRRLRVSRSSRRETRGVAAPRRGRSAGARVGRGCDVEMFRESTGRGDAATWRCFAGARVGRGCDVEMFRGSTGRGDAATWRCSAGARVAAAPRSRRGCSAAETRRRDISVSATPVSG